MSAVPNVTPCSPRAAARPRPKAQLLFRACAAHVVAHVREITPDAAAERLFSEDELLHTFLVVQRAAANPALTGVPEWAGNLVRDTWAEFVELMAPVSVYARLADLGARFSYDQAGRVNVPGRDPTPTLAGDFIGENVPIPVRKAGVRNAALPPKKLAVLSTFSAEMAAATGGRMEAYIRDFMVEDTANVLDARLLDSAAANDVRPAGLLNGVTPIASSGATLADIVTDIKAALAPVLAAGGGRRLVWLMNPLQAVSLALQTDATGAFLWPDADQRFVTSAVIVSVNVPLGTLILVDAAEFATAADDVPQFYVSNEATLHMDDTAPEPINDGAAASPVISLFQQDAYGLRMLQQMNWAMRRPGLVSAVTGIQW